MIGSRSPARFAGLASALLLVSFFVLSASVVIAQPTGVNPPSTSGVNPPACPAGKICNPLKTGDSIEAFFLKLIDVAIAIGSVLAIIFLIYAGFLFVTAQGNEEKLRKAKSAFLWTVIGIAVLLGAKVIQAVIAGTVASLK